MASERANGRTMCIYTGIWKFGNLGIRYIMSASGTMTSSATPYVVSETSTCALTGALFRQSDMADASGESCDETPIVDAGGAAHMRLLAGGRRGSGGGSSDDEA